MGFVALSLLAGLSACGGEHGGAELVAPPRDLADPAILEDGPRRAFVGMVEGTDAAVGVVVSGHKIIVYFCGGAETVGTHSGSLFAKRLGASREEPVDLAATQPGGTWRVEGRAAGAHAEGLLWRGEDDPAPLRFRADATIEGTMADVYAAPGEPCRTTAVLIQPAPDAAPILQGTACLPDAPEDGSLAGELDAFAQVVPVMPISLTPDGLPVTVPGPEGDALVHLNPVAP